MRSAFREVARLLRDRSPTADIPISMHGHAKTCRAEHFHPLRGLAKPTRQIQFDNRHNCNRMAVRYALLQNADTMRGRIALAILRHFSFVRDEEGIHSQTIRQR